MTIKSLFVALALLVASSTNTVSASAFDESEICEQKQITRASSSSWSNAFNIGHWSWKKQALMGSLVLLAAADVAMGSPASTAATNCATSIDMGEIAQAGLVHLAGIQYKMAGNFLSNLYQLGYHVIDGLAPFSNAYNNINYYSIAFGRYHLVLSEILTSSSENICQYVLGVEGISDPECWIDPDQVLNLVRW